MNEDSRYYFSIPGYQEIPVSSNDLAYTVQSGEEGRLDKISYKFYDNVQYWWVIAVANDIINPLSVKAGDSLRIPDRESLFSPGGILE
jgi:nucleoid-associated protein YgaU